MLREEKKELINHPSHYGGDTTYEAIKVNNAEKLINDFSLAMNTFSSIGLNFNLGNVVKYIARAGQKQGESELKDLKKAVWYLNDYIKLLEENMPDQFN